MAKQHDDQDAQPQRRALSLKPVPPDVSAGKTEDESDSDVLFYGAADWGTDTGRADRGKDTVDWEYAGGNAYFQEDLEGSATEALTGGITAGGESEDLTQAYLHGLSERMGGPSGGDVSGAGRGGSEGFKHTDDVARGGPVRTVRPEKPGGDVTGQGRRVSAENTETFIREEIAHGEEAQQQRRKEETP